MSYNSIHMGYPIFGGYRRSQLQEITVATLSNMTWRELRMPDPYLNGNTKWQEMEVVAFFFKNGFINNATVADIGYWLAGKHDGSQIVNRLNRVNTQALLSFGTKLMMSGLLKRDWAWILDYKRTKAKASGKGSAKPGARVRPSKHRITFSKAIVTQAIKKYSLNKVCMKLRVDMKVIRFWLDYKI